MNNNGSSRPSVDSLLQQARSATGLDDFGHGSFREGLETLLDSAFGEARLSSFGASHLIQNCINSLIVRLHVQAYLNRYPQVIDIPIGRPLFVLGLPRTGSTMTQALLAQNPACRAPVFWEMHRPVRFPDEPDDGSRRESACRWIEDYYRRAPDEKAAHLMDVDSPDECLRLLQHNFTTLIFATRYCVKTYPKWLVNADLRPAYRYHRQLLQLQLHTRTGAPLVLKDPFHTWHLDSLFEVFPDACVVQLHRDLRQVLPSWLRLCAIAQGVSSDAVDPSRIRDQWLPLVEIGLERMAMVRKIAPSRAFLDIAYSDLVRDPAGVIRRIDEHFGFSFPEEAYSRARSWLARNPRHKHGKHRYSLEEFGLETGAIRERFAGYYDRFGPMLDEAR